MTWLIFAISGYFFYAVSTLINKFLLRQKAVTKPMAFTFWVGVSSIFTFVLVPFGLHWPGWSGFILDLLAGIIFFAALFYFYRALDINEASRAASVMGGLLPIFILIFSYLFLDERLGWLQLAAFLLLVVGGILLSLKIQKKGLKEAMKGWGSIFLAILVGAIYWVLEKHIFNTQGFITGFIWTRLGLVIGALLILLYIPWRRTVFTSASQATGGIGALMIFAKLIAGLGSLSVHFALSRASAPLVQALQGTEYVFLLMLVVIFSKKFPQIIKEKTTMPKNICNQRAKK